MAGEGVRGFFLAFESDSKGFGSYQAGGRPLGGRFGECSDVGRGVVRAIGVLATRLAVLAWVFAAGSGSTRRHRPRGLRWRG